MELEPACRFAVAPVHRLHGNQSNFAMSGNHRTLSVLCDVLTCLQKLQEIAHKRMAELKEPAKVKLPVQNVVGVSSSPQEILAMMEQLKDKVANEPDGDERDRLIARIQALHASYGQLTAELKDGAPRGGGSEGIKASLQAELDKHAADLKVIKEKEAEQRQQLDDLREKLEQSQPHIDRLHQERKTCLDVARNLRDKITAINEEWQGKFNEFKEAMDTWAAERKEVQKERCVLLSWLCSFAFSDLWEKLEQSQPHILAAQSARHTWTMCAICRMRSPQSMMCGRGSLTSSRRRWTRGLQNERRFRKRGACLLMSGGIYFPPSFGEVVDKKGREFVGSKTRNLRTDVCKWHCCLPPLRQFVMPTIKKPGAVMRVFCTGKRWEQQSRRGKLGRPEERPRLGARPSVIRSSLCVVSCRLHRCNL
jgi:hypothetical protein